MQKTISVIIFLCRFANNIEKAHGMMCRSPSTTKALSCIIYNHESVDEFCPQ